MNRVFRDRVKLQSANGTEHVGDLFSVAAMTLRSAQGMGSVSVVCVTASPLVRTQRVATARSTVNVTTTAAHVVMMTHYCVEVSLFNLHMCVFVCLLLLCASLKSAVQIQEITNCGLICSGRNEED